MARPKKCRKVCCMPAFKEFAPVIRRRCSAQSCSKNGSRYGQFCSDGGKTCETAVNEDDTMIMTVDEYETIRLIDFEGLSQEECCLHMDVARTTVQQIYNTARKKIAEAIVKGMKLKIEGGRYELCNGRNNFCGCGKCMHRSHQCCSTADNSAADSTYCDTEGKEDIL